MPTPKQMLAPLKISEEKDFGKGLRAAGYSDSVSKKPKLVTESKGFKEAAKELGIVEKLEMLRDMAADRAIETVSKAKYPDAARSTETFTKQIQLLTGKPTENFNELRNKSTEELQSIRDRIRTDKQGAGE